MSFEVGDEVDVLFDAYAFQDKTGTVVSNLTDGAIFIGVELEDGCRYLFYEKELAKVSDEYAESVAVLGEDYFK